MFFGQWIHFAFPAVSNAATMPTCTARKSLNLLEADLSGPSWRARMRAMLPRVTSVGDVQAQSRCLVQFCLDRQTTVGTDDLLPMVELVIQQIAAASISTNGQLGLLALWKRPHRARIGALPA